MDGVLRGPAPHSSSNRSANGTFQRPLPVLASSRRATSCFPFSSRQTSLPPERTGEEKPPPMEIFQTGLRSGGRPAGARSPAGTQQSRVGPCHCGQSAADSRAAANSASENTYREAVRVCILPCSFHKKCRGFSREIVREQRQRLPLRAGQIRTDAHGRAPGHFFVEHRSEEHTSEL